LRHPWYEQDAAVSLRRKLKIAAMSAALCALAYRKAKRRGPLVPMLEMRDICKEIGSLGRMDGDTAREAT